MIEKRHEMEAAKILDQLDGIDDGMAQQARRLLAEALENAERRGRERSASLKESSG